ncbi:MAG: hypothetical protein E7107_14175 [Prevotella sp.]|nr:hypothetical protein [Prevotella sp.]
MKELLEKMIIRLRKQVEEKVPAEGLFPMVYECEDVSEKTGELSEIILKVSNTGVKGSENKRYLEFGAIKDSCPYGVEVVVGYGSTQDILARLQEDELLDKMMSKIPKFIEDIEYEERHPWG